MVMTSGRNPERQLGGEPRGAKHRLLLSVLAMLLCATLNAGLASAVEPKEKGSYLSRKEFFLPELYISTSHAPLEDVLPALPNRAAWENFQAARERAGQARVRAFVDPRSGAATNLLGDFPLLPGRGNRLPDAQVDPTDVAEAVLAFAHEHRGLLGIDTEQLGPARATAVSPTLWQVTIPQTWRGIPVRHGRLAATINHGNLVLVGTEGWGDVRGLSHVPRIDADAALGAGFDYAGGRSSLDEILRPPTLEAVPTAPPEHQQGEAFAGPLGAGYRHRLAWTFTFRRTGEDETWEVIVDAGSGEVIAFEDINLYAGEQVKGGVYPLTNTGICPNDATCGTMQSGWPMPFADTGLASPNNFTNSAGVFDYTGGTVNTTLSGRFVDIVDSCGTITNSSTSGTLDLGGSNGQHDCTTAGGSAGNTASARSAFYEVNKLVEQAAGWLPGNNWLASQLRTNVNLNSTCNAFWNGSSINFYRSGGGCGNTGEIAGVFDHEWGHGLDDNDAAGILSNTSEAYADIAAIYRLHTSCVGHGFFTTNDNGCGTTADGTGFNANEGQTADHCDLDCSGVRDADWAKHSDNTPDTALGFVCNLCTTGSGLCGRQVHCSAAPARQAAWDLVTRDLAGAPFSFDRDTAFILGNKLFYEGSGNVGNWFSCTCGSSSSGCGATNGYMQWLAADDDNGNLNDGTPHMTAIFDAFDRHGIACATPTPQNGGCSGGPSAAPTLIVTPGDFQSSLTWNTVSGASEYWVFRTEGHAGCDFGKARIAQVSGTSFTDTEVANGRAYSYNVVAAGTSAACFSPASACVTVTPAAGGGGGGGGLVLSEVMYDPDGADGGLEWVELFNSGSSAIDLSGFSLGSGGSDYASTTVQLSGMIAAGATFVVGGPTSSAANGTPVFDQAVDFSPDLQNGGTASDGVALFDVPAAQVTASTCPIDAVIYDSPNTLGLMDESCAAGASDVADAPGGQTVERVDLAGTWQVQASPTPNSSPLGGGGPPPPPPPPPPSSGNLLLSEVFYDDAGADNGLEWVELYNDGSNAVDLSGWSLGWGGTDYTSTLQLSGTIAAGATFVVGGPTSQASNGSPIFDQAVDFSPDIQNSGSTADGVALFNVPAASVTASTCPQDAVIYGGSNTNGLLDESCGVGAVDAADASSGSSIERTDAAGTWQVQASPTPNTSPLAGAPPPPPPPPAGCGLTEDFSGDVSDWGATGLWHLAVNTACATPGYSSAVESAYYGQETSCDYATGAQTTGVLTSPVVTGVTADSTLTFQYFRQVEGPTAGSFDTTVVQVKPTTSGAWTTVWSRDSTMASSAAWTSSGSISLASFAGSDVEVRFVFDSVDATNNGFVGWMVDDVTVTCGGAQVVISEVFYDDAGTDNGLEWVELYNAGSTAVDLSGWSLGSGGGDYTTSTVELTGTIAAGATFVVGGPTSQASNGSPTYDQAVDFSPDFQNSGSTADGVALFDVPAASVTASTCPVDAVIYGGSNTSGLLDESCAAGAVDVGGASSGSSIERTTLSGGWQIQAAPTPNVKAPGF